MQSKREFIIPITKDGITAVDWLAEASGFSKQKIKQYMQQGCVWLERLKNNKESDLSDNDGLLVEQNQSTKNAYIQRLRRAKKILNTNEVLHFYYDEKVLNSQTAEAVLIEDFGDYSIWNKPSGMLSQGSKWGDHCTIYRWAEKNLQPERSAFIVHRLDRAANGLIIIAHKKSVASQFSRMFEKHEIEKCYQVEVEGDFSALVTPNKKLTIDEKIDNKTALSHVSLDVFDKKRNTSLLNVRIETGRKHQIRKHLAGIGFPVMGDRLYGIKKYTDDFDLQLRAKSLNFICPVTSESRNFTLDS